MYPVYILIIFLISCGTTPRGKLEKRNIDEYYLGTGFVDYFLPQLPSWANYSSVASCRRDISVRYVNLEKLMNSLSFDYESALSIQNMFNNELNARVAQKHIDSLNLGDEEKLFYDVSQRVRQGQRTFKKPRYDRVHVIWLDSIDNPWRLKKLLSSQKMSLGHPVLLSMCLSRSHMKVYLKRHGLDNKNIRLISTELLSPYTNKGELSTQMSLDLSELMKKKKIYFFSRKRWLKPKQIKGQLTVKYF